jgi:SRSO17 transposase
VTNTTRETTASVSVRELERVCKEVDGLIGEKISSAFMQQRTYDKAVYYAGALSSPFTQNKTSWGIAEYIGYENPGPVQSLMGENKWDYQEVWDGIAVLAEAEMTGEENDPLGTGAIVDETADEKRGNATAGVGYQYAGFAGKTVNCTTWVAVALSGPRYKTWVSCGLYLPKKDWFTGRGDTGTMRRRKAGIPKGTRFMTKPEIARKQFQHLRDIGVDFRWAGGDEVYGRYAKLRRDHERNGEAYAYFVPRNHMVTTLGKERRRVDELLELSGARFEARSAGPGVNGPLYYEWAMIGIESPCHYLLIRRPVPGRIAGRDDDNSGGTADDRRASGGKTAAKLPGEQKENDDGKDGVTFILCYVPPDSAIKPTMPNLILMAGRRWDIEETNAVEKGPVGWDENQFLKWRSLHRHTALAGLATLRANMILRRLEEIAAGTEETAPAPDGDAAALSPETGTSSAEPEPEYNTDDLRIPLGDSLTPDYAGQEIPDDIGFIRLSVNELMRLTSIALSGMSDARKAFHLRWSKWRRKHQAIARWYHQAARMKETVESNF